MSFKNLIETYKFNIFPRTVGNPYQFTVNDYDGFYKFMYENSVRKNPLYTSANGVEGDKVHFYQMFFDFDKVADDFEICLSELKETYKYFEEYNKVMSFSGTGLYLFLRFEPFTERADRIAVNEFQRKFKFESLDLISAEPKHICRVPSSRYVKKGIITDRYCIPINKESLSWSEEEFIKHSKRKDLNFIENNEGKLLYPHEDIITDKQIVYIVNDKAEVDWLGLSNEAFEIMLKDILDEELYNLITLPKPKHNHLYVMALKLKSYGVSLDESYIIFNRVSENWTLGKDNERYNQLKQIYRRDYYYKQL